MRIWFDTEFIENGRTIDLLSIGMVREDGKTLYREAAWTDHDLADSWIRENVLPHLQAGEARVWKQQLAVEVVQFAGEKPEFWAYYADYDWVALCQIFGRMIDLPKGWPKFCLDVKQLCHFKGNPELPKQISTEHHALADAEWTQQAWNYLVR